MGIVYYYCGATAFENIIKNHQIWLSDITRSNDKDELIWYADIIKKHFSELFNKVHKIREDFDSKRSTDEFIKNIDAKLRNKICFAMCFSSLSDDLSQWRGYGDDGEGYAIGFDDEIIKSLAYSRQLNFEKVKYTDKWDAKCIDNVNDEQFCNKVLSKLDMESGSWACLKAFYNSEINRLLPHVAYYKNPSFNAEQESRLFFFGNINEADDNNELAIHFNKRGFIPHVEINFNRDIPLIKEIIIGPDNRGSKNILQMYCKQAFDYKSPITVKKSLIHYKSRG